MKIKELPVVLEDPKTQVYLPIATTQTKGIASFDAKDFNVDPKGKVALNEDLHQIKENTDAALRNSEEALEQVVEGLGSKVYVNGVLQGSVNVDNDIQEQFDQLTEDVEGIQELVPSQASSQNQLADKNFVNSSINAIAAFYITYDSQGNPFPTKAALSSATTFYSGGETRVPTRNDYCLVLADETHGNASCRYVYTGQYPNGQWDFQFVVNESPLTSDQVAAINSGITSALVQQIPNKADLTNPEQNITTKNLVAGGTITADGEEVLTKSSLLELVYPIGSIYININNVNPQNFLGGTWERLPAKYTLWTTDENITNEGEANAWAGTGVRRLKNALPNIKGSLTNALSDQVGVSGAFYNKTAGQTGFQGSNNIAWYSVNFSAYYGDDSTYKVYRDEVDYVQPPAYKVHVWKRTA